jgi:replicative DNA helicase
MRDNIVERRPKLTKTEIDYCLVHMIRVPELFAFAKQHLLPMHFSRTAEISRALIWSAALDVAEQNGGVLPAQGLSRVLGMKIVAKVDGSAGELSQQTEERTVDLLDWIFGFDETDLNVEFYRPLIQQLILERTVCKDLKDLGELASSVGLPADLAVSLEEKAAKVRAVTMSAAKPARSIVGDWDEYQTRLAVYRGRDFLGLRTGMQQLDERTLGLRGLMMLGAMPNVGKTALVLQLGVDVVKNNPDACFLMVSLEMGQHDLYTRIHCNLAEMDYKTLVFGAKELAGQAGDAMFTTEQLQRLDFASTWVAQNGHRIRILDRETLGPQITTSSILAALKALKTECGASRALIALDYLQLVPIPNGVAGESDLEADKYRVRVAQDIVAGTRTDANPVGDALLVISEARKPPSGGRSWGEALADLMGSARLGYAADAVFLYRRMNDDEITNAYSGSMGTVRTMEQLEEQGISPVYLRLEKGRDGMRRGEWGLEYRFNRSIFREIEPTRTRMNVARLLPPGRRNPGDVRSTEDLLNRVMV